MSLKIDVATFGNFKALVLVFVFLSVGLFFMLATADAGDILGESEINHRFTKELILTAPFSVPRLSFFHATLEVPPLEPAQPLPPEDLYIRVTTSQASSIKDQNIGGVGSRLGGLFHEWGALDVSLGVLSRLEIGGRLVVSGWYVELRVFLIV
jgi:hypothetical protein